MAYRPCDLCLKFIYDHKSGRIDLDKDGKPKPRVPGVKLPCQVSEGMAYDVRQRACAKISPESRLSLNERNQQAYEHYRQCRAVGQFPDDPIVRRNAAIIRALEDEYDADRLSRTVFQAMSLGR